MPTPISRVEVTVASASVSPLDPANFAEADRGFTVFDSFSGFGVFYALQCSLLGPLGVGLPFRTVYVAKALFFPTGYVGDARTPAGWSTIQLVPSGTLLILSAADGGASYQAGGTMAIEKDWDGFKVTFFTPLGNMVMPLDTVTPGSDPAIGNFSRSPSNTGFWHSMYWVGTTDPVLESARWKNFYWSVGGVHVDGAALTSADPGMWEIIPDPFEMQIANSNAQETLDYLTEFHATIPANDFFARATEYRRWIGRLTTVSLDLTAQREFNTAWGAWTSTPGMNSITTRRSDNDGHTWTDSPAVTGSDLLQSVTIQARAGRLFLCYYDVTLGTVQQSISRDAGTTWSAPVPVAISGTNPRLVIDTMTAFFYFSISGGNIVLQRSFDVGATLADAAPILVATGVPIQEFAAVMAPDRRLLVAYADAGLNWVTRVSSDFGQNWSDA
jgi:hypothetical protein